MLSREKWVGTFPAVTGKTLPTFLHPLCQATLRPVRISPWAQLNMQRAAPTPDPAEGEPGFEVNQPRPHHSPKTKPHIESTWPTHTPTQSISRGFSHLLEKQLLLHIKLKGCVLHYLNQKLIFRHAKI